MKTTDKTMREKINCWEFHNCGMEPGGIFARISEPCPVPQTMKLDGVNSGRGGGRACWKVMNESSQKDHFICRKSRMSCFHCEFFLRVHNEEECPAPIESIAKIENHTKFVLS